MSQTYQVRIKKHLAKFKLQRLAIEENGVWKKNGKAYPHILPEAQRNRNILPTLSDGFHAYRAEKRDVQLHSDFHHLNSSQAMAFNLILPLRSNRDVCNSIFPTYDNRGGIVNIELEHIFPDDETNVDALFVRGSGARTLIELKYTENSFGSASSNERRMHKLETIYAPRLQDHVSSECLTPTVFFRNYQLMRNLFHVSSKGTDELMLIFPKGNNTLSHCENFFENHISSDLRKRVRTIYLEDLVTRIEAVWHEPNWAEHYRDFREKYLPAP